MSLQPGQRLQYASPQKSVKSQNPNMSNGKISAVSSSIGDRMNGRESSSSKLVKPSPIETKNLKKNVDYSPNSAQLQFHSSLKQNSVPFDGIQVQLISASDYQMQKRTSDTLAQKMQHTCMSQGSTDGEHTTQQPFGSAMGTVIGSFQNGKGGGDQNPMQMFYGDYVCDDEPEEEDDNSNQ
jgi:hypothetical protein